MFARPIQSFRRYLLDRMVLRPSRGPMDHGDLARVMMDVAGKPLETFVARNFDDGGPADLVVLKFPGTAGRAERSSLFPVPALVPTLGNVRGEVWTWNPPGYGGSHGRATLSTIAAAGQAFADGVLQRDDVSPKTVWLCGNSLGCNVAMHVAASLESTTYRVGLILRNPPPLVAVVKNIAARYPMGRYVDPIADSLCDSMNAMRTAPRVRYPAVFLQSELDTLVPPAIQNEVIAAYGGETKLVQLIGLTHDGIFADQQKPLIVDAMHWLWTRTQS